MSKKILSILLLIFTLSFTTQAFAFLTFTSNAITGTTASTIDLGSENDLFLQTSGGKIGIGTITPGAMLDINEVAGRTNSLLNVGSYLLTPGTTAGPVVNIVGNMPTNSNEVDTTPSIVSVYSINGDTGTYGQTGINIMLEGGNVDVAPTSDSIFGINSIVGRNDAQGGGTGFPFSTSPGNGGGTFVAGYGGSTTPGINWGVAGISSNSMSVQVGVLGHSLSGGGGIQIGVLGYGNGGTTKAAGGYFRLSSSASTAPIPTVTTSAAIIADNGTIAAPILLGRDNGSVVFTIADGGAVTSTSSITSTQFKLSALNTAPTTAAEACTTGEIRIATGYIYVCVATNSWQRSAMAAW